MKQKLIVPLFLLMIIAISMQSCIHDELYSENNSLNKEYQSKSPFKEDEIYIKNIMSIYEENESEIKKIEGIPLWDYAMTLGNLDETFLVVPISSNNKIITCIQVPRNENQVSFKYDNDPDHIKFFQAFISSKQVRPIKQTVAESNYSGKLTLCHVTSISMWYPDDNYAAGGYWETQYFTKCDEIGGGSGPSNPDPNPQDPTYPYPGGGGGNTGNNNVNPCQKIKEKQNNAKYSQKFSDLNKPEIFDKSSERGFYELQPPIGVNVESGFVQVDGPPGTTGLNLPDNTDRISGLFHSHNNTEGSIKIFSPTDVKTFINIFLKNARVFAGSYAEAYSTVVTSEGSYTLKYSLITSPGGINYQTSEAWKLWYEDNMRAIQNSDGSFDQAKVEKVFMQFLNESVNINGLEMYKVTANTSSKLTYNPTTKQVSSTPCPQ